MQRMSVEKRGKIGSPTPFPEHMHPVSLRGAKTQGIPEHVHPIFDTVSKSVSEPIKKHSLKILLVL